VPTHPTLRNGDIILTGRKHQGLASSAIRLGGRLRLGWNSPFAIWPHCAIIYDAEKMISCEATGTGVQTGDIFERFGHDWDLIQTNVADQDWPQVKEFLDSCLTAKWRYGFAIFAGLAVYCLSAIIPFIPQICFQQTGTAVCSGLTCDALTRAGYIWELPPFWMMPADIAAHFDFKSDLR
jgi:hypothetical protein